MPVKFDGKPILIPALPMSVNPRVASSRPPNPIWPGVIMLGGIFLTLWMQRFSADGVVFSGDGGLKALLAQDIAQQLSSFSFPLDMALRLPGADWVRALWQQGLYPFQPPYVYEVGAEHFITFPFTFPLVSAPFYALFGDRGLYFIPLLALWATWGRFWQIGRRAGWDNLALCMGLVVLIFASPLSIYGGMYWEHTLAVALAFWGVTALLFPKEHFADVPTAPSLYTYTNSGILIGLAVWFRPEFLCLVAATGLLAILGWLLPMWKAKQRSKWRLAPTPSFTAAVLLIGSMACTVGIFFALNYGIYGHPLGIHAIQIVEESSLQDQLVQAQKSYGKMFSTLVRYFPAVVVVAIATIASPEFKKNNRKAPTQFKLTPPSPEFAAMTTNAAKRTQNGDLAVRCAIALSLLFALLVPLIVPPGSGGKQWGPRFYLILVPMLTLVLAQQLKADFFHRWARQILLVGAALVLVLGTHLNTLNGAFQAFRQGQSISLPANYDPIAPAMAELQQQPSPWVAMSHEFVAQQLWSAFPDKTFFRTETVTEVKQLAAALVAQNESEFLYVCYPHEDCYTPTTPPASLRFLDGTYGLKFVSLGTFGKYPLYKVEITS